MMSLQGITTQSLKFLVVALGLDTAKGDPTGSWLLIPRDFFENGHMIGQIGVPTLIVQEGGYKTQSIGTNARNFFAGLWEGVRRVRSSPTASRHI